MPIRILSIDYGTKNIGFAISDSLGIAAHPLPPHSRKGGKNDIDHVLNLIKEYSVSVVVIGLPVLMDGSEGDLSRAARAFGKEIKSALPDNTGVKVEFYDERLTTSLVERMLIEEADVSRAKRKKIKDKLSAVVILQNYMDSLQRGDETETKTCDDDNG